MNTKLLIATLLISIAAAVAPQNSAAAPVDSGASPNGPAKIALSDGGFLELGGQPDAAIASADIWQIKAGSGERARKRVGQLQTARLHHTATILPGGQVLVLGGRDAAGNVIGAPELFDPSTGQSQALTLTLLARAQHTATVLLDGCVLIVGGIDDRHQPIADAELWNSYTGVVESVRSRLELARYLHETDWGAGAHVLIRGGLDEKQTSGLAPERYSPLTQSFALVQSAQHEAPLPRVPRIVERLPASDARDIPPGVALALRFDRPMQVASLTATTVTLFGPDGPVKSQVVAAENGRLLFITPKAELRTDAAYTLFVHGAKDTLGVELPFIASGFRTAALAGDRPSDDSGGSAGGQAEMRDASRGDNAADAANGPRNPVENPEEEVWRPGPQHRRGDWYSGRSFPKSRDAVEQAREQQALLERLPARASARLKARMEETGELVQAVDLPRKGARQVGAKLLPGAASVSGQALRLNGKPLADVTMSIGSRQVRTDANGDFILENVPTGPQVLVIDGRTAGKTSKDYGRYEYRMVVEEGENDLPFTIWMTRLDTRNAVRIASPTAREEVITHPDIPGLELRIPAGAVIRDADGKIVTEVSITPVPVDKMPFPMPYAEVNVFYTIQPGGARIQTSDGRVAGATLHYPNYSTQPPGARVQLFDYDPQGRGWYVYTGGRVAPDGNTIQPDKPFTIYQFTASSAWSPASGGDQGDKNNCQGDQVADPVICNTGSYVDRNIDLALDDVLPIGVVRHYRHDMEPNQRSFGIGSADMYSLQLYFDRIINHNVNFIQMVNASGFAITFSPVGASNSYVESSAVFESADLGPFYKARLVISRSGVGNDFIVTLKDGSTLGFAYYGGNVKWLGDRHGNRTTIMRDARFRTTRVVSPNGAWLEFEYGVQSLCKGCITRVTDHTGRFVRYEYDGAARLARFIDAENNVTEYIYDAAHRMISRTDARGHMRMINGYWDESSGYKAGRMKDQTYPGGQGEQRYSFDYEYDSNGRVIASQSVDERRAVRRVEYDDHGYMIKKTHAFGTPEAQTTSFLRDPVTHFIKEVTDHRGKKTRYDRDPMGNVKAVTRLAGTSEAVTWQFEYEPRYNQVDLATDPLGRKTDYIYDSTGNIREARNDAGQTVSFEHNRSGQLEAVTRTAGGQNLITRMRYDDGRLLAIDHAGSLTQFTYDTMGRVSGIRDGNRRLSLFDYDKLDRLKQRCNPAGECARFSYDPNSNLTQFVRGATQRDFSYDWRDRLEAEGRGPLVEATYVYGPGDVVARIIEASGRVADIFYDKLGRPIKGEIRQGSVLTRTIDVDWDAGNRPTRITDSVDGTLAYTFDDRFDAVKTETGPSGTMTYSYYANGLRQTAKASGGTTLTYRYDNANQLTSIEQAAGAGGANSATAQSVHFSYDGMGRRTKLTLANGITLDYGWNDKGDLASMTYRKAGGALIGDLQYGYDDLGQRITKGGTLARTSLPSARLFTLDAQGRLATDQGRPISWDAEGRLQSDATRTYLWNDIGELKEIRDTATGNVLASFAYDPIGRRIAKTVGATTTRYLHDGDNPIQLQNAAGIVQENILAGGTDEWFARTRSGATSHFITDALGSTLRLTDQAGNKTVDYLYDTYGSTTFDNGAETNPFQYTGRENDGTGLYYYRARYYNPNWARFISQDPIGLDGGDNLYAYVDGDPVSFTDPLGLFRTSVDAYCAQPQNWAACTDIFGDLVTNAAWLNGDPCAIDSAASLNDALRTAGKIAAVATVAGAYVAWARRPFWQYYPAGNPSYSSPWLTRGRGWWPPYKPGLDAQQNLSLPPWNPGTAVRKVPASSVKNVEGPRTVKPEYGQPGGGQEYRIGGF